jgi:hypothetical protein
VLHVDLASVPGASPLGGSAVAQAYGQARGGTAGTATDLTGMRSLVLQMLQQWPFYSLVGCAC